MLKIDLREEFSSVSIQIFGSAFNGSHHWIYSRIFMLQKYLLMHTLERDKWWFESQIMSLVCVWIVFNSLRYHQLCSLVLIGRENSDHREYPSDSNTIFLFIFISFPILMVCVCHCADSVNPFRFVLVTNSIEPITQLFIFFFSRRVLDRTSFSMLFSDVHSSWWWTFISDNDDDDESKTITKKKIIIYCSMWKKAHFEMYDNNKNNDNKTYPRRVLSCKAKYRWTHLLYAK